MFVDKNLVSGNFHCCIFVFVVLQGTNGPRAPASPYPAMKGGPRGGANQFRATGVTWGATQPYTAPAHVATAPASQVRYTGGAATYTQPYTAHPASVSNQHLNF